MIDCHCHLMAAEFDGRRPEILATALRAGVSDIVMVSEDLEDARQVVALAQEGEGEGGQWPRLHMALGMHPEKASADHLPAMLDLIRAHGPRLACIGEVGLDFSPHVLGPDEEAVKSLQRHVFSEQCKLAQELGLAVNVHSRSAGHHAIALLQESGASHAVLHAFDGKAHYAEQGAALGYYFSVPPSVVRSPHMQKMVKRLPLESLLLETDAPALAPDKGEVNEPKNLRVACSFVAELKGVPVDEVIRITSNNARSLMRLAS